LVAIAMLQSFRNDCKTPKIGDRKIQEIDTKIASYPIAHEDLVSFNLIKIELPL
jgi:hypothetical protein